MWKIIIPLINFHLFYPPVLLWIISAGAEKISYTTMNTQLVSGRSEIWTKVRPSSESHEGFTTIPHWGKHQGFSFPPKSVSSLCHLRGALVSVTFPGTSQSLACPYRSNCWLCDDSQGACFVFMWENTTCSPLWEEESRILVSLKEFSLMNSHRLTWFCWAKDQGTNLGTHTCKSIWMA